MKVSGKIVMSNEEIKAMIADFVMDNFRLEVRPEHVSITKDGAEITVDIITHGLNEDIDEGFEFPISMGKH